jgi:hypothetical protein
MWPTTVKHLVGHGSRRLLCRLLGWLARRRNQRNRLLGGVVRLELVVGVGEWLEPDLVAGVELLRLATEADADDDRRCGRDRERAEPLGDAAGADIDHGLCTSGLRGGQGEDEIHAVGRLCDNLQHGRLVRLNAEVVHIAGAGEVAGYGGKGRGGGHNGGLLHGVVRLEFEGASGSGQRLRRERVGGGRRATHRGCQLCNQCHRGVGAVAQVGQPNGALGIAREADDGCLGDGVDDGERHLHALHGGHDEAEARFVGLLHRKQETVGVAGGLQAAGGARRDTEQLGDGVVAVDGGLEVAGAGGSRLRQREVVGDRPRGGGRRQRDVGVGGAGEGSDDLCRAG